jgi:hypothetical protein
MAAGIARSIVATLEGLGYIKTPPDFSDHSGIVKKTLFNKPSEPEAPEEEELDFVPLENQHRGFVPPPYKYLGPGNSLNQGQPFNYIDDDARSHDIEYSNAKSKADVYNSDKNFLSKAGDHLAEGLSGKGSLGNTLGAAAGIVGIGGKHLLEKSTGTVLHPSISGKQWHLLLKNPPLKRLILINE